MACSSLLFARFCDALNAELAALGCSLRISPIETGLSDTMLLLDAEGNQLGWLPEHVDAASIAAFEHILAHRA